MTAIAAGRARKTLAARGAAVLVLAIVVVGLFAFVTRLTPAVAGAQAVAAGSDFTCGARWTTCPMRREGGC